MKKNFFSTDFITSLLGNSEVLDLKYKNDVKFAEECNKALSNFNGSAYKKDFILSTFPETFFKNMSCLYGFMRYWVSWISSTAHLYDKNNAKSENDFIFWFTRLITKIEYATRIDTLETFLEEIDSLQKYCDQQKEKFLKVRKSLARTKEIDLINEGLEEIKVLQNDFYERGRLLPEKRKSLDKFLSETVGYKYDEYVNLDENEELLFRAQVAVSLLRKELLSLDENEELLFRAKVSLASLKKSS